MFFGFTRTSFKREYDEDVLRFTARALAVLLPILLVVGRAVADISLSITAILFLVDSAIRRDWGWLKVPWVRLCLVLWAWIIASGLVNGSDSSALVRSVGWIRLPVFAVAMTYWFGDRVWFERLVVTTCLAVGFVAVDAWIQYLLGRDIFGFPVLDNRLTGPFGRHKQVGIFITKLVFLALLPLLMKAVDSNRKGPVLASCAALLVFFMTVFISGERTASLLYMLGAGIALLAAPSLRRFLLGLGAVAVLGAVLLAVINPTLMKRHIGQTTATLEHFSQSPYGKAWSNGVRVAVQNPVFGVGPKNFRHACTCEGKKVCGPDDIPCMTHPHNLYIEWAAEMGFPGLLGFLFLVGLWLARMREAFRPTRVPMFALGGWVAVCLQLWPFASTGSFFLNWNEVLFWLALGVALAGTERAIPSLPDLKSRRREFHAQPASVPCCDSSAAP